MKTNPSYPDDLSESGHRVCSEAEIREEHVRQENKPSATFSPADYADYRRGIMLIKSLEFIVLLLCVVAVCLLTGIVAKTITPDCIQSCLAFGMCLVLSIAGLVSGVFTLIGGIILMIRHSKKPCSLGVRLIRVIILGISVMAVTLCVYCYLLQIPQHTGKHECRLIPWSP